jgi:hypothetical protein
MNKNKSNKVKMNKFKILEVAFLAGMTMSYAQNSQAKKKSTPKIPKMLR